MATLEEEIKRRQVGDALALLEYPEAQAQAKTDQSKEADKPDTADQDIYSDWCKWPSIEPDKIPAGHIDLFRVLTRRSPKIKDSQTLFQHW